jgi:hypothetical protein
MSGIADLEQQQKSEGDDVYYDFCLARAEPARSGVHKILAKLRNFLNKFVFGPIGPFKFVPVWLLQKELTTLLFDRPIETIFCLPWK